MCGIAGIFVRSGATPDAGLVERMRDVMLTRGPDAAGLHLARGIGLGHRRLSIIDLSPAGHQPMTNEDETLWVVLNGEIYNFQELRVHLEATGHRFRSRSDTEVLLHGYEEWGRDGLLERIQGMFAFALWDGSRRRLLLARDRVGKKPLFYADVGGCVYFASDIKSIWLALGDRLSVDPRAIDEFLYFYYINQDRTIFHQVQKLAPAAYLEADPGGTRGGAYWDLSYAEKDQCSEPEWIERSENTLRAAVARRLVADVPLGAFLSGGVDSGLIVALMSQMSSRVKTFSIGTGLPAYDELSYARQVATRYGTDHHEYVVDPRAWEMLPQLVWHYGEPFGDSSAIPTYFVSKMARQGVTVALTGDGGDESFCGYRGYAAAHRAERSRWLPVWARRRLLGPLGHALEMRWPDWHFAARVGSLASNMSGDLRQALRTRSGWCEPYRKDLYTERMHAELATWHPLDAQACYANSARWRTYAGSWQYVVAKTKLPSDYLVKVDVASMMNSMELRCPFLDREVLELTARMPIGVLLGPHNETKYLLKCLALKYLPSDVVRRRKQGFELPIAEWLRGPWNKALRRIILGPRALARGYFQRGTIERVLMRHSSGRDHRHRLWSLLWLELWHQMFVDRTLKPDDTLSLD